jgi:hypothetical protein
MKLLAVAGDIQSLIADIRMVTPLCALVQAHGGSLVLRSLHDCTRADLAAADVLVLQRGASARAWRLQHAMRLCGGAVVAEIDDLLTDLPAHISNQAAARAQRLWIKRCLMTADVVTVSTARLGAELHAELRIANTCVVPNSAFSLGDLPLPAAQPGHPVHLLLAAMDQLAAPWLLPALRGLQGTGVKIVVVGPAAATLSACGLPVQAQPLMPRAQFIAFARTLPNVVAVIPLADSRFGACKSAIKWFEYSEAGIPVLCSDVSPYREVVQNGVTGALVANQGPAWDHALRAAVADAGWRQRVALAARAAVRQHHAPVHTVAAWQAALSGAVQRRAQTTLPLPTLHWRLQDALAAAWEPAALRLRAINRARLVRREQSRQKARQ